MTLRSKLLGFAVWTSLGLAGCPNPTGGDDAGASDAPTEDAPLRPCTTSDSCDDGIFCNGEETCVAGSCAEGTALRCNDDIACTSEYCSEETRACVVRAVDEDRDGHPAASCVDARGMALGDDCDDAHANIYPGALELCDATNVDEDCDPSTRGSLDADGDGFEDARCCNGTGAMACGTDCNDAVRGANPMAVEVCNLIDDDCDGRIDEGVSVMGFLDMDGDGRGNPAEPRTACGDAAQFSVHGDDCDDSNSLRSPTLPEVCDGQDNDCVGSGDTGASAALWYLDRDGDGFGAPSESRLSCARPTADVGAYVLLGTDCDDTLAATNPAQAERCDGHDNDCNGLADFVIAPGDLEDDDRDGIADLGCAPIAGTDCDDRDPVSGPGSPEVCDGRDNDCDGMIDDGASSYTFYRDEDGDGFGSAASGVIIACASISGYVRLGNDCSDLSATRYPGAPELCNGLDDDCSGTADDFEPGIEVCAPVGNATYACTRGRCRASGCTLGHGECDGNPTTVCEADTTQRNTCGSGCAVCDFSQTCDGAGCSPRLASAMILNGPDGDIVDVIPVAGAGAGSGDAFVALNVLGETTFGRTPSGTPFLVGHPPENIYASVLRVTRSGTVVNSLLMNAPGPVIALTNSPTHLYVLGTFEEAGASFGTLTLAAPAVGTRTAYIAAIEIATWTVTSVASFSGDVNPTDITLATDGTLGITGTYGGPLTIGATVLPGVTGPRAFIATLPSAGSGLRTNFSSAVLIGGSGTFNANAIAVFGTQFFIAGNVNGAIEQPPSGLFATVGFEGFVVRYSIVEGLEQTYRYFGRGGFSAEHTFRDIIASAREVTVVGDVVTYMPSTSVIPVRLTLASSTLTPLATAAFAADPNAPRIDRIATRGSEALLAGTVDDTYGTVVPTPANYGSMFFGATDGTAPLSTGRVLSLGGNTVPHAFALDPDDGAIWMGGVTNQGGEVTANNSLDGVSFPANTNAGFLFVFTR